MIFWFILRVRICTIFANITVAMTLTCWNAQVWLLWNYCTNTFFHWAVFTFTFIMLCANTTRFTIDNLCIWIHNTPIKFSMTELSVQTSFNLDSERIIDLMFVAKNLFIHIYSSIMYWITCKYWTNIIYVKQTVSNLLFKNLKRNWSGDKNGKYKYLFHFTYIKI